MAHGDGNENEEYRKVLGLPVDTNGNTESEEAVHGGFNQVYKPFKEETPFGLQVLQTGEIAINMIQDFEGLEYEKGIDQASVVPQRKEDQTGQVE